MTTTFFFGLTLVQLPFAIAGELSPTLLSIAIACLIISVLEFKTGKKINIS